VATQRIEEDSQVNPSSVHERLIVTSTSSEELGNRTQTPTLIGCMFLRILNRRLPFGSLFSEQLAVISAALNYIPGFASFPRNFETFLLRYPDKPHPNPLYPLYPPAD
jgi:hypothetical protein